MSGGRKIAPVARRSDQPLLPLFRRRDVPQLLAGREHAREIAGIVGDEASHDRAAWRSARRNDAMPKLSHLAVPNGDGEELCIDDMAVMADRSTPSPEALAVARDALAGLPADERAALALDATAAVVAAGLDVSVRTVWNLRARALERLTSLGLSREEVAVAARLLPDLAGDNMNPKHPLAPLVRKMTAEEYGDHLAGYSASWYRKRFAKKASAPAASEKAAPRAEAA